MEFETLNRLETALIRMEELHRTFAAVDNAVCDSSNTGTSPFTFLMISNGILISEAYACFNLLFEQCKHTMERS